MPEPTEEELDRAVAAAAPQARTLPTEADLDRAVAQAAPRAAAPRRPTQASAPKAPSTPLRDLPLVGSLFREEPKPQAVGYPSANRQGYPAKQVGGGGFPGASAAYEDSPEGKFDRRRLEKLLDSYRDEQIAPRVQKRSQEIIRKYRPSGISDENDPVPRYASAEAQKEAAGDWLKFPDWLKKRYTLTPGQQGMLDDAIMRRYQQANRGWKGAAKQDLEQGVTGLEFAAGALTGGPGALPIRAARSAAAGAAIAGGARALRDIPRNLTPQQRLQSAASDVPLGALFGAGGEVAGDLIGAFLRRTPKLHAEAQIADRIPQPRVPTKAPGPAVQMKLPFDAEAPPAAPIPRVAPKPPEAPTPVPTGATSAPAPRIPNATGLANQVQAREVLDGIIKDPEKGIARNAEELQRRGEQLFAKGEDGISRAKEIAQGKRGVTADDVALMQATKVRLVNRLRTVRQQADAAPGDATLKEQLEEAEGNLQSFVDDVQKGKGEWSNIGRALQAGTDLDTGDFEQVLLEARRKNPNGRVQPHFADELKRISAEVREHGENIRKAEAKLARMQAEGAWTTARQARVINRDLLRQEREEIWGELRTALDRAAARTSADPFGAGAAYELIAAAKPAGRYVLNLVKDQGLALDDAIRSTLEDFAQRGVTLSADQVTQEVADLSRGKPRTKNEIAERLAAAKREARNRVDTAAEIKKLERQLRTGDYVAEDPRIRNETLQLKNLRAQRDLLSNEIKRRIADQKPKTVAQRIGGVIGAAKSAASSLDISAPGRQGWLLGLAHPKEAGRAFVRQMEALKSPVAAQRHYTDLLTRPEAARAKRAGLYMSPLEGTLLRGEEAFGGPVFRAWKKANPFSASERAYTTYLNSIRADAFDKMADALGPEADEEALKQIAHYVNVASGRGGRAGSQGLEQTLNGLNTVFFSPRFVTSRFQYLAGVPGIVGLKPGARREIALQYVKSIGALGAMLGVAKAGGILGSEDPASSDFGKIKVGDYRIDPLAGLQQGIVLASRVGSGRFVNPRGEERDLYAGEFGKPGARDTAENFLRSKLAPVPAAAATALSRTGPLSRENVGTDFRQRRRADWQMALDAYGPISVRDLTEAAVEDGWQKEDFLSLLNFVGFSTAEIKNLPREPRVPRRRAQPRIPARP